MPDPLRYEFIRKSLSDLVDIAEYFVDYRLNSVTLKSINEVVREYDDELTKLVYNGFNGRVDVVDMRRTHKALIRTLAARAYVEGIREGGIADDDIDDEDQAQIEEAVSDWITSQLPHVDGFAKDTLAAGKDDTARAMILDRVGLWVGALRTLGDLGKAYALKNERGQWVLGDTEHCDTCVRLSNMKAHRLSWFLDRGYIPRENGSDTLDCHGYNCLCEIVDKKGKRLL